MNVKVVLDDGTFGYQPPSPHVIKLGDGVFKGHFLFEHDCINSAGEAFRSDGYLPLGGGEKRWDLISVEPLTISPSVLCHACGTHGFMTNGVWVPC